MSFKILQIKNAPQSQSPTKRYQPVKLTRAFTYWLRSDVLVVMTAMTSCKRYTEKEISESIMLWFKLVRHQQRCHIISTDCAILTDVLLCILLLCKRILKNWSVVCGRNGLRIRSDMVAFPGLGESCRQHCNRHLARSQLWNDRTFWCKCYVGRLGLNKLNE